MDSVIRAGVEGRSRVDNLLRSNLDRAAEEARKIAHPWYRCQSLASVAAEVQTPSKAERLLRESLAAAREQTEPNRVVTVAAWPVRVMVERDLLDVDAEVDRLLAILAPEPNPVRRGSALIMLLSAVFPRPALRHRVLDPLLASLAPCRGWKARWLLESAAEMMTVESLEAAERVVAVIPESREARRARRRLDQRR